MSDSQVTKRLNVDRSWAFLAIFLVFCFVSMVPMVCWSWLLTHYMNGSLIRALAGVAIGGAFASVINLSLFLDFDKSAGWLRWLLAMLAAFLHFVVLGLTTKLLATSSLPELINAAYQIFPLAGSDASGDQSYARFQVLNFATQVAFFPLELLLTAGPIWLGRAFLYWRISLPKADQEPSGLQIWHLLAATFLIAVVIVCTQGGSLLSQAEMAVFQGETPTMIFVSGWAWYLVGYIVAACLPMLILRSYGYRIVAGNASSQRIEGASNGGW